MAAELPPPPLVPGPPLIGNSLQLLLNLSRFFVDRYLTLGPVFRIRVVGHEVVVITGHEAIRFLSENGDQHFSRRDFYSCFSEELGLKNFILGTSGAEHTRLRSMLRLAFSREVAGAYIPDMVATVQRVFGEIRPGRKISVMDTIAGIACEHYGQVLANRSIRDHVDSALLFSQIAMDAGSRLWPAVVLRRPGYQRAKRRTFDLVRSVLADYRTRTTINPKMTLLDGLLAARDEEGQGFTDDELVGYGVFGFIGTCIYMNRVIAFLLYEILKDPKLREACTAEADAAFSSGIPDALGLRQMVHLRAALSECLRFHPIQLALPFNVTEDFEFGGYRIAKGQLCIVSQVSGHFSERFYRCPYAYDASRCLEPRNEHRARGAFAPFGFGERSCLAVGLIEAIALTTVATVLHSVDLELAPANYKLRTKLNPLPGPAESFKVKVLGPRQPVHVERPSVALQTEDLTAALPLISSAHLGELLAEMEVRTYQGGAVILTEGDPADEFFVLLDGQVEVIIQQDDGSTTRVAQLHAGDYFGEAGLLHGGRRTATVAVAKTASARALVVSQSAFRKLVTESDLMSDEIAKVVRRRFLTGLLTKALPQATGTGVSQMLGAAKIQRFNPGQTIIQQGAPADAFYVITQGTADVFKEVGEDHSLRMAELSVGEYFGEIGLLQRRPRTATVRARNDGHLEALVIDGNDFRRLVADNPGALKDIVATMCQRIASDLALNG